MERKKIISLLIARGCTERWCIQFTTEDREEMLKEIERKEELKR